jgi:serine/threonine-protein kinase/endoribonuclease IRE1
METLASKSVIDVEVVTDEKMKPRRTKTALLRKAIWVHTWVLLSWAIIQQQGKTAAVSAEPLPREWAVWSSGVEIENFDGTDLGEADWSDARSENKDVIVIVTVDGTLAGLSRATGKTLWKQTGSSGVPIDATEKGAQSKEEHMRPQSDKGNKKRADSSRSRLLSPLVSTTTTTTKSGDWKTAAVPSVDGRVYLTAGRESSHGLNAEVAASTTVSELVSRAPFVDDRGRVYVGSRLSTAAALDRNTGEILRVVSGDDALHYDVDPSLAGRDIVWLGRVDYSVSIHDARTGVTDVQFSTSNVVGLQEMIAGNSHEAEEKTWDANLEHAPHLMLPGSNVDDQFRQAAKSSLLAVTPNGKVAFRSPETGEIEWVAEETFDTPVAFAVEASSGKSLGVDILPDTPVPSLSPEYITRELERQMEAFSNQSEEHNGHTIVGALSTGQLFAMPLGSRQGSKALHGLPQPHTLASSASATKNLANSFSTAGKQMSHTLQDVSSSHSHGGSDHKKTFKKPCNPSNSACFAGSVHKGHDASATGPNIYQQHHGQPLLLDSGAKEYGAVSFHYHPDLGYVTHGDQVHNLMNRKNSRSFLRIMASWLPPTMALIFVLSFELGRRHRMRKSEMNGKLESSHEHLPSEAGNGDIIRKIGAIQVTDEVLGYGGHGTVVYKGTLDGRKVAVKRMLKAYHASADREISLLIESDGHPNVVRYFLKEVRGDFVYLALELCDMSLHDMIGAMVARRTSFEANPSYPPRCISPSEKMTLLQVASGVRHLHSLRIVHRDLKPANILLALTNRIDSKRIRRTGEETEDQPVVVKFDRGEYIAKISDMGLGKQLAGQSSFGLSTLGNASIGTVNVPSDGSTLVGAGPGSVGWQAPEVMAVRWPAESSSVRSDSSLLHGGQESFAEISPLELAMNTRTSRSVDIFSLGCIFYCTLIPGSHPFGEWYEREANIMRNKPNTEPLENLSGDAYDLVTVMISRNPNARPTAKQVCCHPFFWTPQQRLSFLCDVSDRLESSETGQPTPASSALALVGNSLVIERNAAQVVGMAWDKELDPDLISNVSRFRTYDPSSVRDCLRLIRNKHHHYDELPAEIKERIGSNPEGLQQYFEDRFPRLLMHCYSILRESMSPDDPLATKYMISPFSTQTRKRESQRSSISEISESVTPIVDVSSVAQGPESEANDDDDQESINVCLLDENGDEAAADIRDSCASSENEEEEVNKVEDTFHIEDVTGVSNGAPVTQSVLIEEPLVSIQEPPCNTEDIIIWEGSTAAKSFGCRGWIRSDDEWIRRTDASLRKRDSNVMRCADDPKFRTRLCNHWDVSQGTFCPMRRKNKCVFAHGPVELRVKEAKRHRWGKLVDANGDNANPKHSGGEDTYGAARSIEATRKEEGKWNTNKSGRGKGKQQAGKKQ